MKKRIETHIALACALFAAFSASHAAEAGSAILDTNFESVTNRVPTGVEAQQFMKLEIGLSE